MTTRGRLGCDLCTPIVGASSTKIVAMPQLTSPGFLAAMARPDGRRTHGGRQSIESPAPRPHLSLQRSALRTALAIRGPRPPGHAGRTVVRCRDSGTVPGLNRTTGEETPFTVVYGVEGDLDGVPLLISWRPRWWLEDRVRAPSRLMGISTTPRSAFSACTHGGGSVWERTLCSRLRIARPGTPDRLPRQPPETTAGSRNVDIAGTSATVAPPLNMEVACGGHGSCSLGL